MNHGRPLAIVRAVDPDGASQAGATFTGGEHAIVALKALAQPSRMEIFRMVHAASPQGLAARVIAARVGGPHSVVSMHLAVLSRARLLIGQRHDDSVIYRTSPDTMKALLRYMVRSTPASG
jgi:ArsR family transcriptional regulator